MFDPSTNNATANGLTPTPMNFGRDFSKATVKALNAKGIYIIGITVIPGEGDMPYANGETGYVLNDNGTSRIRSWSQVRTMAVSSYGIDQMKAA